MQHMNEVMEHGHLKLVKLKGASSYGPNNLKGGPSNDLTAGVTDFPFLSISYRICGFSTSNVEDDRSSVKSYTLALTFVSV